METRSYEDWLDHTMSEIKAAAAIRRTYGDDFRLEDEIRDELSWIRKQIDQGRDALRTKRARKARYERNGWEDMARWEAESIERAETLIRRECAHRDELSAGLREMKRQDREELKALARLKAELARERGES